MSFPKMVIETVSHYQRGLVRLNYLREVAIDQLI